MDPLHPLPGSDRKYEMDLDLMRCSDFILIEENYLSQNFSCYFILFCLGGLRAGVILTKLHRPGISLFMSGDSVLFQLNSAGATWASLRVVSTTCSPWDQILSYARHGLHFFKLSILASSCL